MGIVSKLMERRLTQGMKWNGEKLEKIGFAFAQNKVWELGMTENKLVFKRRTQGNADQTMLFRYTNGFGKDFGNGEKYNEVELKSVHPTNPAINLDFQGR